MMLRKTTVCPTCGCAIPPRWTLSPKRRDLRTCPACGELLFRVNTDRQPWTMLVLLLVVAPGMLGPLAAFFYSSTLRWWGLALLPCGLLGSLLVDVLQFPFTNGYRVWYPTCVDCGYDMRGSADRCPECDGKASCHPEARPISQPWQTHQDRQDGIIP